MKIQNVTPTTLPLVGGDGDDAPPAVAPPDNVPNIHLPSADEIAQRLREQRQREAGSATQESAVASMAADGAAAGPYALLGEPPLASALRAMPGTSSGIIVIGGAEATRASTPTAALPPDGPLPSVAAFEGEAPPLGHLGDPKNRDVGKDIDALRHRAQSTSASGVSDPLTAAGSNPQSLPPENVPGDVDAPGLFRADPLKVRPR
jgi:hypothetical protein